MLGAALFSAGDVNESAGIFNGRCEANPHFTIAHSNLASALIKEQRWEPAAGELRQVLEDKPDDSEARQKLGDVLRLLGTSMRRRAA